MGRARRVTLAAAIAAVPATLSWLARRNFWYAAKVRGFEAEIVPEGAIVFVGSSTVRLWETLARDFAPWPVINRGFGGAVVSQCLHYAPQLIPSSPRPRAIVFYCGGNDVAWLVPGSRVADEIARFIAFAKERAPGAPFYLVSIAKTPSRFLSWRRVDALNGRLRALAEREGARFVDVATALLGPTGRPRRDLFVFDGVHPSPAGYAVWTKVIREHLDRDLVAI